MPTAPIIHQVQLVEPLLKVSDYISIAAIFLGPIVAIQLQKFIERGKQAADRRESIFKTLMATRGTTLSLSHVEALNRIDLEFSNSKKYKRVVEAWKEYFDNLSNRQEGSSDQIISWATRNEELLANLLYEMGVSLGFTFDKVLIKRNVYSPVGHGKDAEDKNTIQAGFASIMRGDAAFPVYFVQEEDNEETTEARQQRELRELMIKHYTPSIETPAPSNSTQTDN